MENLKKAGASDIIVFLGGIIPDADLPFLKDLGVREVFQPGTNTNDVVSFIKKEVGRWLFYPTSFIGESQDKSFTIFEAESLGLT